MMRIRRGLVLGLLALGLAGCGGTADDGGGGVASAGGPDANDSTETEQLSEGDKALRFAQCMRDNGVPNYPDPTAGDGGGAGLVPEGTDPAAVDAARDKCVQYLPNGGEPPEQDPESSAQLLEMAECMRENGVPEFPDPEDDGRIRLPDGLDPTDPMFKAAEQECSKYQPGGGTPQTRTDG